MVAAREGGQTVAQATRGHTRPSSTQPKTAHQSTESARHVCISCQYKRPDGSESRTVATLPHSVPGLSRKWHEIQICRDTSVFCASAGSRMAESPNLSRRFCIPCQDQAESDTKHRSVATLPHSAPAPEAGWQRVQICRDTSVFHARIKPKVARNTDLSRHFRILCQAETRVAESLELSRRFWVVRRRQKPGGRKNRTVATDAPEDLCLIIAVGMQVACR